VTGRLEKVKMSTCVNTSYVADCRFGEIVTSVCDLRAAVYNAGSVEGLSVETVATKGNEESSVGNSSGLHSNTKTILIRYHHVTA
jgi:hypothetical protein